MAFLGSFLQYFIILVILALLAVCGIFTGKKLRMRKNESMVDGTKKK